MRNKDLSFLKIFNLVLFVLFFVLGLDFLWRFSRLTGYLTGIEILKALAMMFVMINFIAFIAAFLSSIFVFFLASRIKGKLSSFIASMAQLVLMLILVNVFLSITLDWVKRFFGVEGAGLQFVGLLFLLLFCLSFLISKGFAKLMMGFIEEKALFFRGIFLFLLIVSLMAIFVSFFAVFEKGKPIESGGNDRPNILFVTIDKLGSDRLSLYGYPKITAPNISKLGKLSYVFVNMYANGSCTAVGMRAMLTGDDPKYVDDYGFAFDRNSKTLASALEQHGYQNIFISSIPGWNDYLKSLGFFEGFIKKPDSFIEENWLAFWFLLDQAAYKNGYYTWLSQIVDKYFIVKINEWRDRFFYGKVINQYSAYTASKIKKRISNSPQPFFLWAHLFVLHDAEERDVPSVIKKQMPSSIKAADQYDKMLWYGDYLLGDLMDFIKTNNYSNNTIIIVSSDHSYPQENPENRFRIPLIIHLPGQEESIKIVSAYNQTDIRAIIENLIGSNFLSTAKSREKISFERWGKDKSFKLVWKNHVLSREVGIIVTQCQGGQQVKNLFTGKTIRQIK